MRVLGLDPGTATTGWACVEQAVPGVKPTLIACGAVRTPAHTPLATRLATLAKEVDQLLTLHAPNVVAVEELFFAKNRTTAIAVSHARGVLLLTAARAELEVAEYTPMEVKQAIVGYGRANKQQIMAMLPAHLNAAVFPRQDDTADAVAIALTHLAVARNPLAAALARAR